MTVIFEVSCDTSFRVSRRFAICLMLFGLGHNLLSFLGEFIAILSSAEIAFFFAFG